MPESLSAARAAASARTLKPMMRAREAIASVTSDSVIPPTPLAITRTVTSSLPSCDSESRSASALPCTSALPVERDLACLALALDNEQVIARVWRVGQAQYLDGHRRTRLGELLAGGVK